MVFGFGEVFFKHLSYDLKYLCQVVIGHPFQDCLHEIVIGEFLQEHPHRILIGLPVHTVTEKSVKGIYEKMGVFCHDRTRFPVFCPAIGRSGR